MHYGSHLREAFCDWVEEGCPPTVDLEVKYEPAEWPRDRFLRRMLNCSDVVPQETYSELEGVFDCASETERPAKSYGAVAQWLIAFFEQEALAE